ncbi:MAG: hypothetical protein M4579_006208 [Chaenotheca gracillima]|nr:MAG: hypothetical protein M4579_006208 [Chaenotheca gracillima]
MSTFNGIVAEFPEIRIDRFRLVPDHPPPLACFLSHVHSDHLLGLESFRSPFIYCSHATRELLLRLEKYPHRMNFAKGILESRKVTYKHLKNVLANHCTGAVMFLIEGDGKAILYTGDIRAESWWVNSIVRNPIIVSYCLGSKTIDTIYLDTSFATSSRLYETFPSKAEGLAELLEKVRLYPAGTIFHFNTWTFGYEEVWIALAAVLGTKIHLDEYRMGLYGSLSRTGGSCPEVSSLCGFRLGNHFHDGILTTNQETQMHSCERGTACTVFSNRNVVNIIPVIGRLEDGALLPEIGAGGGDLSQVHELELSDADAVIKLTELCTARAKGKDGAALSRAMATILKARASVNRSLRLDTLTDESTSLDRLAEMLLTEVPPDAPKAPLDGAQGRVNLPQTIVFPYSRHSSYAELCHLVGSFKPKTVYPCTVDEEGWEEGCSMRTLFGQFCCGSEFAHDIDMATRKGSDPTADVAEEGLSGTTRASTPGEQTQSQSQPGVELQSHQGQHSSQNVPVLGLGAESQRRRVEAIQEALEERSSAPLSKRRRRSSSLIKQTEARALLQPWDLRSVSSSADPVPPSQADLENGDDNDLDEHEDMGEESDPTARSIRHDAYAACLGLNGLTWADVSPVCTGNNHSTRETILCPP